MTGRRAFAAALLIAAAVRGHAQSNAAVNSRLQFSFLSPGARSLGIGGAFIGLADDATTAYTNPAGITNILAPQLSAELRSWDFRSDFAFRGHILGDATGMGVDTADGIELGRSQRTARGLSFASAVLPHDRWAFALYRHTLADLSVATASDGLFIGGRNTLQRTSPSRSDLQLHIASYGLTGAYQLTENLSVGVSAARYDFGLHSRTERFFNPDILREPRFQEVALTETQEGVEHSWSYDLGALWRIGNRTTVGAVFRRGAAFDVNVSQEAAPELGLPAVPPCHGSFSIPNVVGIGASVRVTPSLTVSGDLNHIGYSALTRNFVVVDQNGCHTEDRATQYSVSDVLEPHLGVAWALPVGRERELIVSGGWWRDPDHSLRSTDPATLNGVLFNQAGSDRHFTAGVGLTVTRNQQLYAAYDVSDRQRTLSISALIRVMR